MEPLEVIVFVGTNLIGLYALFKIVQFLYWHFKDRSSEKEQL